MAKAPKEMSDKSRAIFDLVMRMKDIQFRISKIEKEPGTKAELLPGLRQELESMKTVFEMSVQAANAVGIDALAEIEGHLTPGDLEALGLRS